MKKTPVIPIAVLLLAAAGGVIGYRTWVSGKTARPELPAQSSSGDRIAPPFVLKDISGNRVGSDAFRGKPTVINFFATWCPPCREEIPGFVAVHEKYRDRGFELVGIALDTDSRGNLPNFIMNNRIGYRILLGDVSTTRAYGGVSSIPTTFFVGKDGRIRNVHVGYMDRKAFEDEVRKLL